MLIFGYLMATGLTTGALYALVALGIVIVFRSTNVVNFAHGEMFMIGGFIAWTAHVAFALPFVVAFVIAIAASFVVGALSYQFAFRPLMRASNLNGVLLAMIGVSFMLKGIARDVWGGKGDYLTFPPLMSPRPIQFGGIMIMSQQLVVLGAAVAVMLAFWLFFRFTRAGKFMQATADNPKAARLVGLRVDRVHMYTFGIGAAIAGAAATLMAPLTLLYPDIGFNLFIKGFAAAVLGGLASVPGAIVGGFLLGVIEQLSSNYISTGMQDVAAFLLIFLVMIFIPGGLFGSPIRRRV
ncbi:MULTISPECIES: branched-chain amino acid ABC transporter permease [unclassified Rhizobium]|nr:MULTISPECIES: branched-chain amino acid ABC transporter permease [unclassified Rhizobium]MBZ5787098.1 branched-chain amino acid ABC transporter permease [Rhizobium sp. VS19-DR121]MBZ5762231.1 branched-chain amino acid ABC transporter permease [Rhizobium sp. VS19-DR96]MBZ5804172.1 branched-chain amino acid ABC transporter permease [Rhizobium sp. VS19-DR181]MBZ5820132.1 branched-chain amino acid ABC transporter permease [Rhizobium sp. VS19-DR183]MBZ5843798.1 branched-chain amino acid ABC tran